MLTASFCTQGDSQLDGTSHSIDSSDLTALTTLGLPHTVNGLIELANRALGNQATGGADLGAIMSAAGTINEAFDECRNLVACPRL